MRKRLAITMGDPAGIGPEIALKSLLAHQSEAEFVVFGDVAWMELTVRRLNTPQRVVRWPLSVLNESDAVRSRNTVYVRQSSNVDLTNITLGKVTAEAGKAAAEYVISAAQAALAGEVDAIVTGPINKEAIALGGYPYAGHTELLAEVTKTERYAMVLLAEPLRVIHVSTHVSLRNAIDRVRSPRIVECISLGDRALKELGIAAPRIGVAGLNPHAGESGLFGDEEKLEIAPAVEKARSLGFDATGPHPPDTVFARMIKGEFDLVVAMYHDQGHIPVKLNGLDSGVNMTVGLPIIRISVDHGTAFDIAAAGCASEASMMKAIRVAEEVVAAAINRAPRQGETRCS